MKLAMFGLIGVVLFKSIADEFVVEPQQRQPIATAVADVLAQAETFHGNGKARKGVAKYDELLALDPGLDRVRTSRAEFWKHYASDLLAIGRTDRAKEALGRITAKGRDSESVELEGEAALGLGDRDDARRLWDEASRLDPKRSGPWLRLARLDLQTRDLDDAESKLGRALALDPKSLDVHLAWAKLHRLQGKTAEVVNDEKRVQEIRKTLPLPEGGMGSADD